MPDILIRGLPAHVIKKIDEDAGKARLSRSEYVRRKLASGKTEAEEPGVTLEDFRSFAEAHQDLADPDVMGQAWQ